MFLLAQLVSMQVSHSTHTLWPHGSNLYDRTERCVTAMNYVVGECVCCFCFSVEPKLQSIGVAVRPASGTASVEQVVLMICRGRRTHSILGCGQTGF